MSQLDSQYRLDSGLVSFVASQKVDEFRMVLFGQVQEGKKGYLEWKELEEQGNFDLPLRL